MKKFAADDPLADRDAAARKIVEIANGVEAVQDGRIYIERVNAPFLAAGGTGDDFRAGIERAIAFGWLWHPVASRLHWNRFEWRGRSAFESKGATSTKAEAVDVVRPAVQQMIGFVSRTSMRTAIAQVIS
jgi:hypothetical protein